MLTDTDIAYAENSPFAGWKDAKWVYVGIGRAGAWIMEAPCGVCARRAQAKSVLAAAEIPLSAPRAVRCEWGWLFKTGKRARVAWVGRCPDCDTVYWFSDS